MWVCVTPESPPTMSRVTQNAESIAGVDLAWGDRRPDGVCVLEANRKCAWGLPLGDADLLAFLYQHFGGAHAFIALDAPVVCRNLEGARPGDRLTHVRFGRFKAGSHPRNLTRCQRRASFNWPGVVGSPP
jgi:predicted RNase H-like nuclease